MCRHFKDYVIHSGLLAGNKFIEKYYRMHNEKRNNFTAEDVLVDLHLVA